MTPEIERAAAEIRASVTGHPVEVSAEPQGGAYVVVHGVDVGLRFAPTTSWIGFLITFQYPYADVYPHFIDGDLRRADGGPFPVGITGPTVWQGRCALQVSRRSRHWNPATDTAALKLAKVLEWLRVV
jgi:hypothetical protein